MINLTLSNKRLLEKKMNKTYLNTWIKFSKISMESTKKCFPHFERVIELYLHINT